MLESAMNSKHEKKDDQLPVTQEKWYQDFHRCVQLQGLADRTCGSYMHWAKEVGKFAAPWDPTDLEEDQVLDFLISLRTERELKDSTVNQALCAMRLLYREHLGREWDCWDKVKIRREQGLPNVLSREKVATLLEATREGRFRAIFTTIYHCGLRLNEAIHIKPGHIDGERRVIRIINGKGGKSREVPVAEGLLVRLRRFWKAHRNPEWLFPGVGRGGKSKHRSKREAMRHCKKPVSKASVQSAMRATVESLGWKPVGGRPAVTTRTLRHCYATHLLEAGVSIRLVSQYMGHASLTPTMVYLHLTEVSESKAREALSRFPGL